MEVTETFSEPSVLDTENEFKKVVCVKNTGTVDQFVRVFLDFSDSSVRKKPMIDFTDFTNDATFMTNQS